MQLVADIPLQGGRHVRVQYPLDLAPADIEKVMRVLALLIEPPALPTEGGERGE
jgi:hypothetical protein